jgi:phage minor structural protein
MILIDKYSEANKSAVERIATDAGESNQLGQSFTGTGKILNKITLYLAKVGLPTEYIYVSVYAHSGTFGTSSIPTGSALAISNQVSVSSLGIYSALIDFTFTGSNKIALANGTKYVWIITTTQGTSSDNVLVGIDSTSPTHGGNYCFHNVGGAWSYNAAKDVIFYVWGDEGSEDVIKIAEPTKLTTTKEVNGAWYANMDMPLYKYLAVEQYVAIETVEYIVKKCRAINDRGKTYNSVELDHVMSELSNYSIDRFKYTDTVSNILGLLLAGTNWSSGTVSVTATVTIQSDTRITVLEALYMLANACGGELYFNSDNAGGATDRTVDIKAELGTRTNRLLRADKNCSYIEKEEDSTNLVTKIFPYGPDNMPMNSEYLDDMDDETLYTPSGAGTVTASNEKMQGTQAIQFFSTTLDETFIRDFGAG